MKYYQQGDVVLIRIEKVKGSLIKGNVLQEGEHTGHAHRITEGNALLFQENNNKFLKVNKYALLTHEEHLPITIEEGEYEVKIVRQKDPFTKLISKVVD